MINQDELREEANVRFISQAKFSNAVGITNVYFNYFLKSKRNVSEKVAKRIKLLLASKNMDDFTDE